MIGGKKNTYLFLCTVVLLLSACSPIHFFTRVKKTPNEYSRNYCCGEVAVPKSVDKKSPWIVYSDRSKNATYYNPGGKVQLKEASFMEPFLVIGEKGEYLRLVKYDASILEDGQLKDKDKAEYYGWMHKDNLVLTSRAMTNVATGSYLKMITMFRDTTPLSRTKDFFSSGEVVIFQEPELLTPIGTVPFQNPIFLAKRSADRTKSFLIGQEMIKPDNSKSMVAGWVSSSLVMPLGELLYADFSKMPIHDFSFSKAEKQTFSLTDEDVKNRTKSFELPNFVGMNPVYSICNDGDVMAAIKTSITIPLTDDHRNFVYSLNDEVITKGYYEKLQSDLRKINIMIVFSDQKMVYEKFEQMVSSLQSLNGIIKSHAADGTFKIGYVIGFDSKKKGGSEAALSENIDSVLFSLEAYADAKKKKNVDFNGDAWSALKRALKVMSPCKSQTNIVLLMGENGNVKERVDASLVNDLVNANCRILGCQLSSKQGNSFNNFVLQTEDMISRSATLISQKKKRMLVHSEQLRPSNQYKEFSKNGYSLNFPKNSMTQGWILFPKNKEFLSPDLILSVTDSIISEVAADNRDVLTRIESSFKSSGVGRTSINPIWLRLGGVSEKYDVNPTTFQPLASLNPSTNYPVYLKTSIRDLKKGKFILFLTESELNRIRGFMKDLTAERVDYKYAATRNKKKQKRPSCPDVFLKTQQKTDSVGDQEYLNTSKARRSMRKAYLNWARDEKVYPLKKRILKRQTLSQVQQIILTMPSFDNRLRSLTLANLKNKDYLSDRDLDKLQEYFISKRKELEEAIVASNKFVINGETYYKIEIEKLP